MRYFGGLSPPFQGSIGFDKFIAMHFPEKGKMRFINRRKMQQPYTCFLFYFHQHWFEKHIIVIHTKWAWLKVWFSYFLQHRPLVVVVVVFVAYLTLIRLLYLALSADLGLLCMSHPGMGPLV